MALAGLALSVSGFANAGFILFEWDSSDNTQSLEWSIDTEQLPNLVNVRFVQYETVFESVGFGLPASFAGEVQSYILSEGGGVYLNGVSGNFFDGRGLQIFSGTTASPTFLTGTYALNVFGSNQNGTLKVSEVPEPTTLAIFALGVLGLASRRFKK